MDGTLLTILLLLLFATVIGIIQGRRRDRCLKDFEGFHLTLAEKGGDLSWGQATLYTTGIEITYVEPVVAREGHLERSFIFYKEQYDAMEALYRYPVGLPEAEQWRRKEIFRHTINPGFWRRWRRRVLTWVSMVRDALVQAIGMVIGVAKARAPGSAVLSSQEAQLKALSSEIIGHAGNAFDPLLEHHLFSQVVLEVTSEGHTRSYCGWLKDYTSQFVELVDAYANPEGERLPMAAYAVEDARCLGVHIHLEDGRLCVTNQGDDVFYLDRAEAGGWARPLGCVLPPGFTADLTLPADVRQADPRVWLCSADRVDLIVPRTHALVRHAASGSEARLAKKLNLGAMAEAKVEAGHAPLEEDGPPDAPATVAARQNG